MASKKKKSAKGRQGSTTLETHQDKDPKKHEKVSRRHDSESSAAAQGKHHVAPHGGSHPAGNGSMQPVPAPITPPAASVSDHVHLSSDEARHMRHSAGMHGHGKHGHPRKWPKGTKRWATMLSLFFMGLGASVALLGMMWLEPATEGSGAQINIPLPGMNADKNWGFKVTFA